MKEEIRIREYKPTDKQAVLTLLRLNTPAYFSADEEADFAHYLDQERELYFVAEVNGNVIGCGGINFASDGKTGKISWDIVHPDYQGKSVGSRLLQHRIQLLESMDHIRDITVRTSQFAHRFYENHGFLLRSVQRDYWAEGIDLYDMARPSRP